MEHMNSTHPVEYLKAIEDGCRGTGSSQEEKSEAAKEWAGITYRIGTNDLVSQLGEVVEILDVPELSRVPLTQPWVRGVANIRGKLLPVIDLSGCLTGGVTRITDKTRVLVIDYNGFYSGLIVDEVLGLKHFMDDEYSIEDAEVDDFLKPYTQHLFRRGSQTWVIFSLHQLADSPQFLQAAV
jgi:twitching motility protein PilI